MRRALRPLVSRCLRECPDARWLLDVVQHFGWHGAGFSRPVDARAISCRLRTFLFDGLQRKGRGAFAVVYKVRALQQSGHACTKVLGATAVSQSTPIMCRIGTDGACHSHLWLALGLRACRSEVTNCREAATPWTERTRRLLL